MEIKRATKDTIKDAVELFDLYRTFYKQESNHKAARQFLKTRIDKNESVVLISYSDNGEAIGFAQLYPEFSSVNLVKKWILNDLFVKKEVRQLGVGKLLINRAILFAKNDNAISISLETAKDNHSAKALYEKVGFVLSAHESKYDSYTLNIE